MNKVEIAATIDELQESGVSSATFYEAMSWDDYLQEVDKAVGDDKKLRAILAIKKHEETVESTTLESIITSSFTTAKELIDQMTLPKRIAMLEDLQVYRDHLYNMCSRYGNPDYQKEDQPNAREFRVLMGRIKHLEILQNWLYGIN